MRYEIGINQNKILGGVKNLVRKVNKDFTTKAEKILAEEIKIAYKESQSEVPVLTGTLKASGYYSIDKVSNTYTIGYVDQGHDLFNPVSRAMTSDYFWKIHEDLLMNHPNGGKAKFLEDPVTKMQARVSKRLKIVINRI